MMLESTAPAKINLSLRVLRKREDGFHEISTRIGALELGDTLTVERVAGQDKLQFTCSDATVPGDETNLVVKALRLLERDHGRIPGLKIHLEKRIPHGAGLGGGSSDAAMTLRMLNELLRLNLSDEVLMARAAELGSDVPFFLKGGLCDCTGRGEILSPVRNVKLDWPILLVKLPFGVPTPWAYGQWTKSVEIPGIDYGPQHVDGMVLVNDLERPVFQKHFILAHLKQWLRDQPGVRGALMSGSGSVVFAILDEAADVAQLKERIQSVVGNEVWMERTRLHVGSSDV